MSKKAVQDAVDSVNDAVNAAKEYDRFLRETNPLGEAPVYEDYVNGKQEYTVIKDFVNKFSRKPCITGSRIYLSDERGRELTTLGCVRLLKNKIPVDKRPQK